MKMTSKQFLALVSTTLLTAGALLLAARTFQRKDREFKYRPFFRDKTEYDVLFFGTSHVINGVFPMQLWHDWGITSYNFGEHGTPIPTSYWVMRNAVRYHKPKIAVLDIHAASANEKINKYWLRFSLDIFPISITKIKAINNLLDSTKDKISYITSYDTYHNRWKEMTLADQWDSLCYSKSTHEKGAECRINIASTTKYPKTDKILEEETVAINYIRKFVSFCRENNIVPILIAIPYSANELQQRGINSVTFLAQELGVPYYNMLRMNIVDYDTDFFDDHHLNPSGAYKVTDFLGRTLRNIERGGILTTARIFPIKTGTMTMQNTKNQNLS